MIQFMKKMKKLENSLRKKTYSFTYQFTKNFRRVKYKCKISNVIKERSE